MADFDYSKIPTEDLQALQDGNLESVSTKTLLSLQMQNRPEPSFMERITPSPQTISNYVRPGLEYGGMLAGGVLGAAGGLPGGIAGAGLGYAGGRQAANVADQFLLGKQSPDPVTLAGQAGRDFVGGTQMEMGGGIAGNLLQRGGSAIANSGLPEWLYSRAMKTPMSESWKRTIPTKEWTKREKVLETGMADEIKPNALGKQDVVNRISEINNQVRTTIDDLTQANMASGMLDTNVYGLIKALDPLKARAMMARDSSLAGGAIKGIETEVISKGGVNSRLNPSQLQMLKQEFYKDIDFDMTKKVVNENGRFTTDATKAIAKKAMERLEEIAPELAVLNKEQGYYIDLQKAIEHTIARYEGTNAVGIGAKIMSVRNIGLAALEVVSGTPSFKASLAFALKKAGTMQARNIGKAALLLGTREDNPSILGNL
jgi:hypothetical protein